MEEFIFDDDVDDVGAELEAHCPKCRGDTTHVIVSKYEDEIRKVQCNVCSDVHAYRKPRGESEEEDATATPKKKQKAKPTWEQITAKQKKPPRAYAINEFFKELEVLSHPKFGIGFVTENIGEDKIEVTYQAEKRVLIHNRKNLSLPFLRDVNPPKPAGKTAVKAAKAAPEAKAANGPVNTPVAKAGKAPAPAPVAAIKAVPTKVVPVKAVASKAPAKPAAKVPQQTGAARPAAKKPVKAVAPKVAPKAAPAQKAKPASAARPIAKKPSAKPPAKAAPAKKTAAVKKKSR